MRAEEPTGKKICYDLISPYAVQSSPSFYLERSKIVDRLPVKQT